MAHVVSQLTADTARAQRAFVAADVGGTYARVALVRAEPGSAQPVTVVRYQRYACVDYPSLSAIVREFVASCPGVSISEVAIACAGYLLDDAIINTNLPWSVSAAEIKRELGLDRLLLINDFTAVAYATQYVAPAEMTSLTPNAVATPSAPTLVVGPGTGLGAAVRIPSRREPTVLSTEAGQAALAPSVAIDREVLRILSRKASHIPIEFVLSGSGLVNLYGALCELRDTSPTLKSAAQIADAAQQAGDAVALQTLQVFCGWLGSVIGDLALLYGAQGGVYLAGGVLPQIKPFLLQSDFVARFIDKGAMREVLQRVPVNLIEHGQLGVIGAASWYLDTQRDK